MSNYDDFVDAVKDGAKELAKKLLDGFEDQAKDDAKQFLEKTEQDIKRWTKMLAQGDLTKRDFTDLVQAKEALAEIHALRQAGVALARLEDFRKGLIDLVVNTALDIFL